MAGVTNAGWQVDLRMVRFGYAVTTALIHAVAAAGFAMPLLSRLTPADQTDCQQA